jgi:CheY-like chemotaxis protein
VTVAGDGLEAVERLQVEQFDAVVMDIHMPRMGGIAAVAEIRAGRAGRADMPVIALTADAMAGVDIHLLAAGFDGVAPKPFEPAELLAQLSSCCVARANPVASSTLRNSGARNRLSPSGLGPKKITAMST